MCDSEFACSDTVYLHSVLHYIFVFMQFRNISIAKFISIDYYIVLHLAACCLAFIPYCVQLILLTVTGVMAEHEFCAHRPTHCTLMHLVIPAH